MKPRSARRTRRNEGNRRERHPLSPLRVPPRPAAALRAWFRFQNACANDKMLCVLEQNSDLTPLTRMALTPCTLSLWDEDSCETKPICPDGAWGTPGAVSCTNKANLACPVTGEACRREKTKPIWTRRCDACVAPIRAAVVRPRLDAPLRETNPILVAPAAETARHSTVEKAKHPAREEFFIPSGTRSYAISGRDERTEFRHDSCNTTPR